MKSVVKESTSSRIPLESPDLLARLACSTACGTASGRGLGESVVGCPTGTMKVRKKIPCLMRISRILVIFSSLRWGYISTCCVFRSHSLQHILRSVIYIHQLMYVNSSPFGSCFQFFSNWVKPHFPLEKFKLQALWPLKGWFEFTATGRDAVQVEAGRGWESSSIKKKGEGKGGNLLGKSENPAETCLIFTSQTVLWNILHCRCASWPIPASMTTSISWNMAALRLCSSPCRTQQTQEMAGMIFEDPWISGFFVPSLKTDIF